MNVEVGDADAAVDGAGRDRGLATPLMFPIVLTSLYAAFNTASGEVVGACHERHTAVEFLAFLRLLVRRYPRRDLHVILDNSSTHSTPTVHAWLVAHPRVQFHFTPTGASWLNLVEVWFSILTRKSVRRGSFDTVKALVTHIGRYIERGTTIRPRLFGPRSRRTSSRRSSGETINMISETRH